MSLITDLLQHDKANLFFLILFFYCLYLIFKKMGKGGSSNKKNTTQSSNSGVNHRKVGTGMYENGKFVQRDTDYVNKHKDKYRK